MFKFLGGIFVLLLIAIAVAFGFGWIQFESKDGKANVEIKVDEMKDAVNETAERGKKLIEDTERKIDEASDSKEKEPNRQDQSSIQAMTPQKSKEK